MRTGSLAAVPAELGGRQTDDVSARFHALEARVAQLEQAEAARKRARLLPGDALALARILPAIAGALGSEPFLSRDLDDPAYIGLLLALAGRKVKTIGRLLSRAEGIPIAGYIVEAAGDDRGTRRWRIGGVLSGF